MPIRPAPVKTDTNDDQHYEEGKLFPLWTTPDDVHPYAPSECRTLTDGRPPTYLGRQLPNTDTTVAELIEYLETFDHKVRLHIRETGELIGVTAITTSLAELAELVALVGRTALDHVQPTHSRLDDAFVTIKFDADESPRETPPIRPRSTLNG